MAKTLISRPARRRAVEVGRLGMFVVCIQRHPISGEQTAVLSDGRRVDVNALNFSSGEGIGYGYV